MRKRAANSHKRGAAVRKTRFAAYVEAATDPPLLNEAQSGVEKQQSHDHRSFDVFAEPDLDQHGNFKQPSDR